MRHYIGRRTLLAGTASLLASPAIVHAQGTSSGVALVIGNSKYQWESSLPNVKRDVADVAKRFQALGLKTELLLDVDHAKLQAAIAKFGETCRGTKFAAFYFAGHGVYWEKQTYVVPVDADLANPSVAGSLIPVPSVADAMKDAANRLIVFDSCRNNPADGWRQREAKGAARSDAYDAAAQAASHTPNTLLLFSTAPGSVALDGPAGENSPFATALLRQLAAPSVDLQALPAILRRDLLLTTECRQMLFDISTYAAPFAIAGRAGTGAAVRHDPSRIVELPNAYAYAQANSLMLPPGLVAYRPSSGAPGEQQKIGAYKYEAPTSGSPDYKFPSLIIVLSVLDAGEAFLIQSFRNFTANAGGLRWRHITAVNADGRITFSTIEETFNQEIKWRDRSTGTFSSTPLVSGRGGIKGYPFSRIDG